MLRSFIALSLAGFLAPAQIRVPERASTPLFKGEQGKQRTEIRFAPATGMVTLKLLVQDPNGYFIPNIRRDNFVVYENGVKQNSANVDIEHAPVSLALLLEYGGRYPSLNRAIATDVGIAGRQLVDLLGRQDKLAVWKYADRAELLTDFTQDRQKLNDVFNALEPPGVSEANLYDALTVVFERIQGVSDRKAVILIGSGVDTFSKTNYEEVLNKARSLSSPVYAVSLGEILRASAEVPGGVSPVARLDWKGAAHALQEIATASGGRFYSPSTIVDFSAIYDDIMENVKVRYVIAYKSSTVGDLNTPRTVRVELVNPKTGGPLQIVDASGKKIQARVIAQESYIPAKINLGRGLTRMDADSAFIF